METTCASAVVAQGLINGNPPSFKPPYQGPGDGMVQGPARGAKIVSMGNYYAGGYMTDYHLFAAYGYDGIPGSGDEPNIISMSFGSGDVDADGWDFASRFIASLNRRVGAADFLVELEWQRGPRLCHGQLTLSSGERHSRCLHDL